MSPSSSLEIINVLLVEDSPVDVEIVERTLNEWHGIQFRVERAGSLGAARLLLATTAPDVVLLDLGLPDSKGLQTLFAVLAVAHDTAIVVRTGDDDGDTGLQAIELGAQDYVVKGALRCSVLPQVLLFAVHRKRLEMTRLKGKVRLATVLSTVPALLWTADRSGEIDWWAGAAVETLRLDPEDHTSNQLFDRLDRGSGEISAREAHESACAGRTMAFDFEFEGRLYEVHLGPIEDDTGRRIGAVGFALDVTEGRQRAAQLRLRDVQLEDTLSQDAFRGIAARVGTELLDVLGQMARRLEGLTQRSDTLVCRTGAELGHATARAQALVRQLLAFDRCMSARPEPVDLSVFLPQMEAVLGALTGDEIEFSMCVPPGNYWTLIDSGHLEHALLSLLSASRSSTPDGGSIGLELAALAPDQAAERLGDVHRVGHRYVAIVVRDSGFGWDCSAQPAHTGIIGVRRSSDSEINGDCEASSIESFANRFGGAFTSYCELGEGHHAELVLPLVEVSQPELSPPGRATYPFATVLLIDDDPEACAEVIDRLADETIRALVVRDVEQAQEIARTLEEPIDLVLTDSDGLGPDGLELAAQLQADGHVSTILVMAGAREPLAGSGNGPSRICSPLRSMTAVDALRVVAGALAGAAAIPSMAGEVA